MNTKPNRSNTGNIIIALGAFNACIAVAAGAFAAHALKDLISIEYLNTFKTAANYQMMHAVGLVLIGMLNKPVVKRGNTTAAGFMFAGILFFSGSLYALTLTGIRWLGMITPIGGVCFLIAWLILGFTYLKNSDQDSSDLGNSD